MPLANAVWKLAASARSAMTAATAATAEPPLRGLSLGAKFVGLTAGLIMLLSLTAFISLRNSAETVRQIEQVVDFAIPAYGALARSHIRSLEEAVALRRAYIAAEDPFPAEAATAAYRQDFLKAQSALDHELGEATRLLTAEEGDETLAFWSQTASLREMLVELTELVKVYDQEATRLLDAISRRSLPEARRRLVTVDAIRNELGQRLEKARADMFANLRVVAQDAQAAQTRTQTATIVVFVISTILGLAVAAIGAVRLIRSIRSIVRGAEAVESGDLETRIEIPARRDEIGRLARSFNQMTEGLRMRERIRETFGRYVDRRIAEQLIGSRETLAERGEHRDAAVMFCDLVGFTGLSERIEPEKVVQFLNAYFSVVTREITLTDGIIDKYIGDAVMAYWCTPFVPQGEVALRSADAALLCLAKMPEVTEARRRIFDGTTKIRSATVRIGIATGTCLAGSVGAQDRRNYTVIGDTVNLASRIEFANRIYRTTVLVCPRTAESIAARFALREIDTVVLPGIEVPQSLFQILGKEGHITPQQGALQANYAEALHAYRNGEWQQARKGFEACLASVPDDGPSDIMLKRLDSLATMPADENWNRAWRLHKEA
jgi:class 3 adenylate cyclase/CHASE3 domain sensor protein